MVIITMAIKSCIGGARLHSEIIKEKKDCKETNSRFTDIKVYTERTDDYT